MKFDKYKFKKNAPLHVKKALSGHIDVIDGLEVFSCKNGYYEVDYEVDEENYYLYPILKEWCK